MVLGRKDEWESVVLLQTVGNKHTSDIKVDLGPRKTQLFSSYQEMLKLVWKVKTCLLFTY